VLPFYLAQHKFEILDLHYLLHFLHSYHRTKMLNLIIILHARENEVNLT
jgi:hypothetical protein